MIRGKIFIGKQSGEILIAATRQDQEMGLMDREPPLPVMAFVYERPQINKFWMKNTKAPLDIVFALNGKITLICKGEPYSLRMIGDDNLSDLVVEFPFGTCQEHEINVGDPVSIIQ